MTEPRRLPANIEAERTILGAVLVADNPAEALAAVPLQRNDFHLEAHRIVWDALHDLVERSEPIDLVTLKDQLVRAEALERVGGAAYLAGLVEGVPRLPNLDGWVKLVRERALLRDLIRAGQDIAAAAWEEDATPGPVLDRAMQRLLELQGKARPSGFLDNRVLAEEAFKEALEQAHAPDGIIGWRTGLADLDRKIQGLRPGKMVTIAARSGQGKSFLAMQIAEAVTEQAAPARVAVFSLEMSGVSLMKRRLASEAMVNIGTLWRAEPAARDERLNRLARATDRVAGPGLMVDATAVTVPQIRAACRTVQARHGLALVAVDYVQLVDAVRRRERRYLDLADISRGLRRLAIDLNVVVVLVAQLNRESEARPDKRPSKADIADGEAMVRDSDIVLLIHREDAKGDKADPSRRGMADIIVDKHRDGWEGPVTVRFARNIGLFQDAPREGATP